MGQYHINDLKLFVPWKDVSPESMGQWRTMAKAAHEQRQALEEVIKQQEARRNAVQTEGEPDPDWWNQFILYPDENDDEQNPDYWAVKAVDLSTLRNYGAA